MTLEESVNAVRKIRSDTEDPEFADLLGDLLAVYDWVEGEDDENAVNQDD